MMRRSLLLIAGVVLAGALSLLAANTVSADDPKPAALPPIPADVHVPTDPVEKAAFDVFAKHCSRCHQAGMLTAREKPARNFGNILKLDETAADPHLVLPGNPDGSKIFQQILNKEMPYDLYYEFDDSKPEVTAADIDAVRAWIQSAGDREAKNCAGRQFVTPDDTVALIAADLEKQPAARAAGMRYLTFANLYDACASDQEMEVYRQGAVKLLNSLARRSLPIRLTKVDDAGTVISFSLDDMGWQSGDWNTLLSTYPYATKPDARLFAFLTATTGSVLPYVRADWFAFAASQPPLYDALLKLPESYQALTASLGVDIAGDIDHAVAQRAGFQKSGVSANNRVIERHPVSTGYFWTSYDFSTSADRQNIFAHPLGPGGVDGFQHAGAETIFSLPDGFQGYSLNRADGTRLDKGPTQIVRDPSRRDLAVTDGISCMGCHDQGLRKAKDEVRPLVLSDTSYPLPVRDAVAALYPETDKMDAVIAGDLQRFTTAMKGAGLDPTLSLNGVEMTNALSKRYEDDLSLRRAAADYGEAPDRFKQTFAAAGPGAMSLMRRLEQGIVPRDQFQGLFPQYVAGATDEAMLDVADLPGAVALNASLPAPSDGGTFELRLNADRTVYDRNDSAIFTVTSSRACSLFVVDVSKDGTGTVIFPNAYQQNNAIAANDTVTLGGPESPFKFTLPDIGLERVVAVCRVNGNTRQAFGRSINLAKEAFAAVPNFDEAFTRQIVVEAQAVRRETAGLDAKGRQDAQNAKMTGVAGGPVPDAAPQSARQTLATTAIVIQVK